MQTPLKSELGTFHRNLMRDVLVLHKRNIAVMGDPLIRVIYSQIEVDVIYAVGNGLR